MIDCVGYEGLYAASDDGRIWAYPKRSRRNGRWLKPRPDNSGYPYVGLYKNCKTKTEKLHRLIAIAFLGQPPFEKAQVNHIDGVKTNNRIENLEWCTAKQNKNHAWRTGITKHADSQRRASSRNITGWNISLRKLTIEECGEVLLWRMQGISQHAICLLYDVGPSVIKRIERESQENACV